MKKRLKGKFIIIVLGLLFLGCITVLAAVQISYKDLMKDQDLSQEAGQMKEFRYHCAFIAQSYEDPFWASIIHVDSMRNRFERHIGKLRRFKTCVCVSTIRKQQFFFSIR